MPENASLKGDRENPANLDADVHSHEGGSEDPLPCQPSLMVLSNLPHEPPRNVAGLRLQREGRHELSVSQSERVRARACGPTRQPRESSRSVADSSLSLVFTLVQGLHACFVSANLQPRSLGPIVRVSTELSRVQIRDAAIGIARFSGASCWTQILKSRMQLSNRFP